MVSSENRITSGRILEIQRMSTKDGPGLRTTVFLKGCSLHCLWCHNPESISGEFQPYWLENRCIGCGHCREVCSRGALIRDPAGEIRFDRSLCTGCGTCVKTCPSGALALWGESWTSERLADELTKDEAYFRNSGGGITISGGEAVLQSRFLEDLMRILKNRRIHLALDTCGSYPWELLEKLLPLTDLVLFDMKEADPEKYSRFTGGNLTPVLQNLTRLFHWRSVHQESPEIWIRTPVIPGMTDRTENLEQLGEILAPWSDKIERWELCAFNRLCGDKYRRLGQFWELETAAPPSASRMENLTAAARRGGFRGAGPVWSGETSEEYANDNP